MFANVLTNRVQKFRAHESRAVEDGFRAATPYFLEVTLNIKLGSVQPYFATAGVVRTAVENSAPGLKMLVAAQSLTSTEFLHIWTMPSADTLRDGMVKMADSAPYAKLDKLVVRTQQDFVTPYVPAPTEQPSGKNGNYIQLSGHLPRQNLAEFRALYESRPQALRRLGLSFWGCFLNVSGQVNRAMSLWVLNSDVKSVSADALRQLPGLDLLEAANVSHWAATPYHP